MGYYSDNRSMLLIPWILLQLAAAPPSHSVDEVLAAVSRNVRDFQERLPDFVCEEDHVDSL